jgi:dynein heavy chain, axonemal
VTESYQIKGGAKEFENYKITHTDQLYNIIEEHTVILSNNKSGQFYKQFEDRIDKWENTITVISEVLENLLQVQ